ncbi:MAG TPA: hypothetical protein VMD47_10430 [Candidatus Acidoferrales bacterium]|nr:hypothetical protein [Candidatus Acidoferrales bacterium]
MLSIFLAAFVHLAILGGVSGALGHMTTTTAPVTHGHMHVADCDPDSSGGPPCGG